MRIYWMALWLFALGVILPQSQSSANPLLAVVRPEYMRDGLLRTFLIARLKPDINVQDEAASPTPVFSAEARMADGRKIIVIVVGGNWCGATGMCRTMILERSGRTFKMLYNEHVRVPIRLLASSTNGHPDISVNIHESGNTNYDVWLCFNGKRYVEKEKLNGYVRGKKLRLRPQGQLLIDYKSISERLYP